MLNILFILLMIFATLTVLLWVSTFFFQGYIYLQPSQQLYWQAPAAALWLTAGFGIWCYSIALTPGANQQNIPYDTLVRFNPYEDMFERPAPRIWAIKVDRRKANEPNQDGEKIAYESKRDNQKQFHYVDTTLTRRPWQPQDVIAIEFAAPDGTNMRLDAAQAEAGEYRRFVSPDGWVMHEFESGPTGIPIKFRTGRLILNLLFNFGHLAGWFFALWVFLRFQWSHALGLALVLWVITTLTVLPMILNYSGYMATTSRTTSQSEARP